MNDVIYWNELSLALRPMTGAAVVLAGFCAASMTLVGASSPAYAMGRSVNTAAACVALCRQPVAAQVLLMPSAARP